MKNLFILKPNTWVGEGKINLNMVEENLIFFTKWIVNKNDSIGKIAAVQEIQVDGISDNMKNELSFYDFSSKSFNVEMENVSIGKVVGYGVYDNKLIAWEFRDNELNFEGYETYHLQKDGSYLMHAEYVTTDQFRTQIEGRIWVASNKKS